jgi:hypothetical protein
MDLPSIRSIYQKPTKKQGTSPIFCELPLGTSKTGVGKTLESTRRQCGQETGGEIRLGLWGYPGIQHSKRADLVIEISLGVGSQSIPAIRK